MTARLPNLILIAITGAALITGRNVQHDPIAEARLTTLEGRVGTLKTELNHRIDQEQVKRNMQVDDLSIRHMRSLAAERERIDEINRIFGNVARAFTTIPESIQVRILQLIGVQIPEPEPEPEPTPPTPAPSGGGDGGN